MKEFLKIHFLLLSKPEWWQRLMPLCVRQALEIFRVRAKFLISYSLGTNPRLNPIFPSVEERIACCCVAISSESKHSHLEGGLKLLRLSKHATLRKSRKLLKHNRFMLPSSLRYISSKHCWGEGELWLSHAEFICPSPVLA